MTGRGLLPSFDTLIFGEYVAYPGVIGLGLAILGALSGWAHSRAPLPTSPPASFGSRPSPWGEGETNDDGG